MPRLSPARTRLLIEADRRAAHQAKAIGDELRRLREDAGLVQSAVARAAGLSPGHLSRIEVGATDASRRALSRVSAVLGADLSERIFPNTGPRIHDRTQAAILEALLEILHPRWTPHLEVPIGGRVRSVIDLVLVDHAAELIVATEVESGIRRLEQLLRWSHEKADGLGERAVELGLAGNARTSRLLVLRSTRRTREVVREHAELFRAEFPAQTGAYASLTGNEAWPGPSLLWADVEGSKPRILTSPPRSLSRRCTA